MRRAGLLVLAALVAIAIATPTPAPVSPDCFYTRQHDGRCNNYANPELGGANHYLSRGAEGVEYADGIRQPITTPNMRSVSNDLFRADNAVTSPHGHNLLWTFMGQFITHDLMGVHRAGDLDFTELLQTNSTDYFIRINLEQPNDALYTPFPPFPPLANPWMRVTRSRGDMVNGRFEIGSDSTAWLDLDVVYGKNAAVADKLRKKVDGLLHFTVYNNYTVVPNSGSFVPPTYVADFGEWLPTLDEVGDANRTVIPVSNQLVPRTVRNIGKRCMAAGDGRAGENYALQMIQGLFLREHNRLAREYKAQKPNWTDEQIYQAARRMNIAQYQAIVYYEYLPSLLLVENARMGPYRGYDSSVDPTVSNLFAFAFRFGHSTVPDTYSLKNSCNKPAYNSTRDGPRDGQSFVFTLHTDQLCQIGKPENLFHSLLFNKGGAIDVQFPESLRTVRGADIDVIAQNQMRAAENGIPGYNTIRKIWHGAPFADLYDYPLCRPGRGNNNPDPLACFLFMNSNVTVATTLRNLYGKVSKINFYTAVLAEEPRLGAVGQTSARIIADQFRRSRDADRFYFEAPDAGFTRLEAIMMRLNMRMSTILQRNIPNLNVPSDAFYAPNANFFNGCN